LGRHEFNFRLEVCKEDELEYKSASFNQPPYALNFYPHGNGEKKETSPIDISDKTISLSAFRQTSEERYMIRLINNANAAKSCVCKVFDKTLDLRFGKYEVKTLLYANGTLTESDSMLDL
jgi:hypothetical protein